MKKILAFFACILIFAAAPSWAATVSSGATANAVYAPNIENNGGNVPSLYNLLPIPATPYLRGKQATWRVWSPPGFQQGISLAELKRAATSHAWWGKPKIAVFVIDRYKKNAYPIVPLAAYPQGGREIGWAKIYGSAHKNMERAIFTALLRLKEKTGAVYYLVLIRRQNIYHSHVAALGTALVGGKLMGGNNNPSAIVGAVGGGSGWGSATAEIDKRPIVKIIAFQWIPQGGK